jgi:hypothetical protein
MPERGNLDAQWISIADKFPSSLAKDTAPEMLADGQTPEAYGLGIDKPGYLYVEPSVSSGAICAQISTVSSPTDSPLSDTQYWRFSHNRLWGWRTDGNKLYYGAYGYDADYLIQDLGYIPCDYESSGFTDIAPYGDNVAAFKSDHLYNIRNADAPGSGLVATFIKQASGLPVAGKWVVVDNVIVWANTYGIFAFDGQQITELTAPIRNNLGTFAGGSISTLRGDFQKRRIVGRGASDTKFIITLGQDVGLYDYSTSGFRFTTKTIVSSNAEPFLIDRIAVIYQFNAADSAYVNMDVKINDTWKSEEKFTIRPANDNGLAIFNLKNVFSCRKFAARITSMSQSLYINSILVHLKTGGILGYSNK